MGGDTEVVEKNCPDMQKNALFLYQDGRENFPFISFLLCGFAFLGEITHLKIKGDRTAFSFEKPNSSPLD